MIALLEVDNVTRSYRRGSVFAGTHFSAVDRVSFVLPAETPEVFTIIGDSAVARQHCRA